MSRFWHGIALVGHFGLFGLLLLWLTWLEPPRQIPISLALILLAGPLLIPMRGLLHGRPYTHAWTSFLALFYFLVGVFEVAGPMTRPWLAWLTIGFSVLLFLGTLLYVRAWGREQHPARASELAADSTVSSGSLASAEPGDEPSREARSK
ncbi:MAG TPA: DUF2069 domain-containing protein [Candidatus Competibacteraceae bacterium]|nr:DUF2069 domain-containing protein [Candidatus Competibacteraceae bacterium]HQA26485.1 DUF2069 domain-containing protein [Candidatus Competibacteraceae bacterium]HQD57412.1 DUF2069 domain-containing protein [Candidatus Competibacteraceae bacterium]